MWLAPAGTHTTKHATAMHLALLASLGKLGLSSRRVYRSGLSEHILFVAVTGFLRSGCAMAW